VLAEDWNYWSLLEISEMERKRRQQGRKTGADCKTIVFKFLIRPAAEAWPLTSPPMRVTPFVAGLNAGIVAQMLPLGLLCAAARISVLQCRNTSEVFREDRPSQESSSSGRRPIMCPSS
jgi:hypothetical protein